MLPLGYALRNLWRRRARTVATVSGIAITTLLVVVMISFAQSLDRASRQSARDNVVVLVGTSSEADLVRSVVARGNAEAAAASAPGVLTVDGQRAASVELHIATRSGNRIGLFRGVTPAAYLVHPQVTVIEGREPLRTGYAREARQHHMAIWPEVSVPEAYTDLAEAWMARHGLDGATFRLVVLLLLLTSGLVLIGRTLF